MGRGNPKHKYRLRREWIENSPAEEDLEVLVNKKLDMTRRCALTAQKANCTLDCNKRRMASRLREAILPLHSGETPHGVLCPALEPSARDRHGPVGSGPEEGHNNDQRSGVPLL